MQGYGREQKQTQSEGWSTAHRKYLRDPELMKLPLFLKLQKTQGVQLILSLKGVSDYNSPPEKQPVLPICLIVLQRRS